MQSKAECVQWIHPSIDCVIVERKLEHYLCNRLKIPLRGPVRRFFFQPFQPFSLRAILPFASNLACLWRETDVNVHLIGKPVLGRHCTRCREYP